MPPQHLDDDARHELAAEFARIANEHFDRVFGPVAIGSNRPLNVDDGEWLILTLDGHSDVDPSLTATRMLRAMYGDAGPPPEFWSTRLGLLVGSALDDDETKVTYAYAAGMLGVTPGTVTKMGVRGHVMLERAGKQAGKAGAIPRSDVIAELARRAGRATD